MHKSILPELSSLIMKELFRGADVGYVRGQNKCRHGDNLLHRTSSDEESMQALYTATLQSMFTPALLLLTLLSLH